MEEFEAVRRSAAELHLKAVAEGADPWIPSQIVGVAAQVLECTIQDVAKADPLLRGGRALYDPEMRLVLREAEAGDVEKALLAGHELGHALLHDPGEISVTTTIDPSRQVEGGETAVDRLLGYSRRERREIQMDLFARELLLPRDRARNLFLSDGLSASEIAQRTSLPYPLVAQQMLDALLLPGFREEPQPSGDVPLDDSQKRASEHNGSAFGLQAGPGTGKTRSLIARVDYLLRSGADPKSILILTFSNKAAGELTERLARAHPGAAGAIWVGTFHAFGLDILRSFHEKLGLPVDPVVLDKADAIAVLEELVHSLPLHHFKNLHNPTLNLSDILSAISRAKDEVVDAAGYSALVDAMEKKWLDGDELIRTLKAREAAETYKAYEAAMAARQALDFGDLVMKPVQLLEQHADVRATLADKHRHVLVDEYQDVNRASVRLIKALVGSGDRLWAVGDSRQSIYRFRGASSVNMAGFQSEFPGAAVDQLRVNYRSSDEVVETFKSFATTMKASQGVIPLDVVAHRGVSGSTPELRVVSERADEGAAVAAAITELRDAGVPFHKQAVLCRGNARLAEIAEALEERDIPILYLGSLFERAEVRNLLALLSLLVDPNASGLVGVATMERYKMPLSDVAKIVRQARSSTEPLDWMKKPLPELSDAGKTAFTRLRADLDGFEKTASPWRVLTTLLLDRTDAVRSLLQSGAARDRVRAIALWQLLAFCRKQPKGPGLPILRLLDRIRRVVLLSDERDLRQMPAAAASMDAVKLMTVHGAKGLEWEAVHVPGLSTSSFPSSAPPPRCLPPDGLIAGSTGLTGKEAVAQGKEEEEECLFFVAMSRAKKHLLLYRPMRMANGNNRNPSKYLDRVAGHVATIEQPALLDPRLPSPGADIINVSYQTAPAFTHEQLALYGRCPRRFFYTHVLGLPGGKRASPFSKLHDVVYNLMDWLRADETRWTPEREQMITQFDAVWAAKGPVGHGYEAEYRAAALELIDRLVNSRAGTTFLQPQEVELNLEGLKVVITPDEVRQADGGLVLRRVRTGKLGSKELEDAIYGLYHLAAEGPYNGASVEVFHLSIGTVTPITYKPAVLNNRKAKAAGFARNVRAGVFPSDADDRTCPTCPHYFACGCLPDGGFDRP